MEAPTYVPDAALLQDQQGSSSLPPSPGFSQVNAEARDLIRGDALLEACVEVYQLICIFRHLLRKEHYDDTCVPYATQVMSSRKASSDISERSTIPIYVSVVSSNGVGHTSTGIISGRSIQVSTPT